MKLKKLMSLGLAGVMALSLAACGSTADTTESAAETTESTATETAESGEETTTAEATGEEKTI